MIKLSHPYMTTGKTIDLTRWSSVGKVMSLLLNTLSKFVTAFLPRSKWLLISCLQSPFPVILELKKIKYINVSTFSLSMCYEVMGPDALILVLWMLGFKTVFHSPLSPSSTGFLVPPHFLPVEWWHMHIWGCWYFSWPSWLQLLIHPVQLFAWWTLHRS